MSDDYMFASIAQISIDAWSFHTVVCTLWYDLYTKKLLLGIKIFGYLITKE